MKHAGGNLVDKDAVGIHVLSSTYGESIVVTLPAGKWFVVDNFAVRHEGIGICNAAEAFRLHHELDLADCLFVLLSHLHTDHYSGIMKFITREDRNLDFYNHYVYRTKAAKKAFFDGLVEKCRRDAKEEAKRPSAEPTNVLPQDAWEIVNLCRSHEPYKDVTRRESLVDPAQTQGCYVTTIAPPAELVDAFLEQAERIEFEIQADSADEALTRAKRRLQNELLNNMSIGLHIVFGDTRILLGADSEHEVWGIVQLEPVPQRGSAAGSAGSALNRNALIKVPHHGSAGAWCAPLPESFRRTERWTIVTHHRHGGNTLPDSDVVDAILTAGAKLFVPNKDWLKRRPESVSVSKPACVIVECGVPTDEADAENLVARLGLSPRSVLRAERPELHWASLSFDAQGNLRSRHGGSQARIFERKKSA